MPRDRPVYRGLPCDLGGFRSSLLVRGELLRRRRHRSSFRPEDYSPGLRDPVDENLGSLDGSTDTPTPLTPLGGMGSSVVGTLYQDGSSEGLQTKSLQRGPGETSPVSVFPFRYRKIFRRSCKQRTVSFRYRHGRYRGREGRWGPNRVEATEDYLRDTGSGRSLQGCRG